MVKRQYSKEDKIKNILKFRHFYELTVLQKLEMQK